MQGNEPKRKPATTAEPAFKPSKNGDVHPSGKLNGNRSFDKSNGDSGLDLGSAHEPNDGTDSGVEVVRALSSNGSNSDRFTPVQSCGSSLVSYSSEPEIDRGSECESESSGKSRLGQATETSGNGCWKPKKTFLKADKTRIGSRKSTSFDAEATSESCSETSSIHEAINSSDQLSLSFVDCNRSLTSNRLHDSRKYENGKSGLRRSESVSRSGGRTYEKPSLRSHSSVRTSTSSSSSSSAKMNTKVLTSRNVKPNGIGKCEGKGGKREADGRWSSSQRNQASGARIRVSSVADPTRRTASNSLVMSSSMTSSATGGLAKTGPSENQSNALDKYGTLPRRPKKKSSDLPSPVSTHHTSLKRSNSVTREPSLNRAATLRNQRTKEKEPSPNGKCLPPYPKMKRGAPKTIIYHEVSVQTVITSEDMSDTGTSILVNGKRTESTEKQKENRGIQTEGKERLKKLEGDYAKQSEELDKFTRENEHLKAENRKILEKISKLLGRADGTEKEPNRKELDELEQHFQVVGLTVIKQQEELSELRRYKAIAHRDLEKSLAAQKNLLQQQQEIEEEYSELQEFLQAEKIALSESLLDTEAELKRLNGEVAKKQSLLEQQQEECKHLVRICEQRRQENLSLEAKLAGLDQRSRDVLVQQGAAVSAAAVALSGLGARLDTLVEQLSVSCNISEKDLEDVIFHNEAYNRSEDNSPSETPTNFSTEEQKRGESFLHVILGAIRNAAQSSFSKKNCGVRKRSDQTDDRLSFFDAVSEPSLNLDGTLDDNTFSNCTDFDASTPRTNDKTEGDGECNSLSRSSSLQNLSDAILNRQAVEKNERGTTPPDEIVPIEVNSLVDQIIDVDNLVTKLLKVIKIIQEGSEKKADELKGEKALLTSQLHQGELSRQKLERNMQRLQQELTEARCQLNLRISQLEEAKALCANSQRVAVVEMQKRFAIIDNALGALNSVQDMVNKCPPLAQLRQELEDCNYENSSGDVNANSESGNGNVAIKQHNGAVLTTAI